MPHYRLRLAYDGTDFAGFQIQSSPSGIRTVQGVLEHALARLTSGQFSRVVGAGRTDAGVHALGQIVSFELDRDFGPDALARALNALLSSDVRVIEASRVAAEFHARRDAVAKLYRYLLDSGPIQMPCRRRFCGHVAAPPDEARVHDAATLFLGRNDFAALAASGGSTRTTIRHVRRCDVRFETLEALPACRSMVVEIEADGFLRKMARNIVGGLIATGQRRMSSEDLRRALESRARRSWPAPAPACGLTLVHVEYSAP